MHNFILIILNLAVPQIPTDPSCSGIYYATMQRVYAFCASSDDSHAKHLKNHTDVKYITDRVCKSLRGCHVQYV